MHCYNIYYYVEAQTRFGSTTAVPGRDPRYYLLHHLQALAMGFHLMSKHLRSLPGDVFKVRVAIPVLAYFGGRHWRV